MSQYAGGDNPNGKALHIGFRWAQKTFTFAFFNPDLNVASSFSRDWEFWAGTYNADINERRVYKNSTLVGRDITTVNYLGEGPFYIGRTVWDQPKDMFGGVIDEVRIFNRPLAPREIEALFRAGS